MKDKVEAFDGDADNYGNDVEENVEQQQHSYPGDGIGGKQNNPAKQMENAVNQEKDHAQDAVADQDEFKPSDVDQQYAQESGSAGEFCPNSNGIDNWSDENGAHPRPEGNDIKSDTPPDNKNYNREDGPQNGDDGDDAHGRKSRQDSKNENRGYRNQDKDFSYTGRFNQRGQSRERKYRNDSGSGGQGSDHNRRDNYDNQDDQDNDDDQAYGREWTDRRDSNPETFKQIWIGALDRKTGQSDILTAFEQFGKIEDIQMRKNFAFVYYVDHQSAVKAVEEMNGFTFINNEKLTVEQSMPKKEKHQWKKPFPYRVSKDDECYKCGGRGHWQFNCTNPRREDTGQGHSTSFSRGGHTGERGNFRGGRGHQGSHHDGNRMSHNDGGGYQQSRRTYGEGQEGQPQGSEDFNNDYDNRPSGHSGAPRGGHMSGGRRDEGQRNNDDDFNNNPRHQSSNRGRYNQDGGFRGHHRGGYDRGSHSGGHFNRGGNYDRRRSRSNERQVGNNNNSGFHRRSRSRDNDRGYGSGMPNQHNRSGGQGTAPISSQNANQNSNQQQHSGENSIHKNYHSEHRNPKYNNDSSTHQNSQHFNESRGGGGQSSFQDKPNIGAANTSTDQGNQQYQSHNKFNRQYSNNDNFRKQSPERMNKPTSYSSGQFNNGPQRNQREEGGHSNNFHTSGGGYGGPSDPQQGQNNSNHGGKREYHNERSYGRGMDQRMPGHDHHQNSNYQRGGRGRGYRDDDSRGGGHMNRFNSYHDNRGRGFMGGRGGKRFDNNNDSRDQNSFHNRDEDRSNHYDQQKCYNCGVKGHIARNCPDPPNQNSGNQRNFRGGHSGPGQGTNPGGAGPQGGNTRGGHDHGGRSGNNMPYGSNN